LETFTELTQLNEGAPGTGGRVTPESRAAFQGIVGAHPGMVRLFEKIRQAAAFDVALLITGPSGSGKELVARAVHDLSARKDRPFVAVNCAAIPESLLESTLFGHVRGAYTGAVREGAGFLGRAEGGMLFLDEIGDLSPALQVKLLRFLQELGYERVGESTTRTANVRIAAATHRDLEAMVREGKMREDFYYRISVFPLQVPPLSERTSDLPLLMDHFLERLAGTGHPKRQVSAEVLRLFQRYPWPGNIRELENLLEYAFIVARGPEIRKADLPARFLERAHELVPEAADGAEELRALLERVGWNRDRAAEILGMSRVTLWKRMKAAGIEPPKGRARATRPRPAGPGAEG
jgi:DNA-binding NtrC family response regulator